jgi:formylglycine-generating enzyme required for sulfatase activity
MSGRQFIWRIAVMTAALMCAGADLGAKTPGTGRSFRDCGKCPLMVVIPAGQFTMGTPLDEAGRAAGEITPHAVTLAQPFAAGAYPVTRAEYGAFVNATHRNWRNPGYTQTDKDPVACVSYDDVYDYLSWLSKRTRHKYRLLSEAEWEYAARGGTNTAYWWGAAPSHEYANYGTVNCCEVLKEGSDRWDYTAPAGSFAPNAFGIYDVSGNIFQWVQDCWHADYAGAPADGSAWDSAECKDRVHRGSSWHASASFIRIGYRVHDPVGDRNIYLGFRIARDLSNRGRP